MKTSLKFRRILAIAAMSALFGLAAWADPPSQVGRLSLISGSVSFHPGSLDEWTLATLNYPLTAGDHLWTDNDSRAEVQVGSAAIRLDSNTEFSFLSLDDQRVQVRMSQGSLNVRLRRVDDGTVFEIDTPNAVVSLPSAGSYRIDVRQSGETSVTVRSGDADVTAGSYAYNLRAQQTTVISGFDSITYYVMAAPGSDEWDGWSAGRDRNEDQWASNPYVSREMIGADELNGYGTWRVEAGFGPAWSPSHVPAGWAPYSFGHWAWVEPWGWTWIDDTPWGFAPFHYGRWASLSGRWIWIPGAVTLRPIYAPALVVFVGGSGWTQGGADGIGWFPLGPGEIYIPPYQVSAQYVQSINITHVVNINVQIIQSFNVNKVVYANRGVPHGMTVESREAFSQSRPAGESVRSISSTEASRAPIMGMTAKVTPLRESIIARPSAARSPVPQPPAALMSRPVYSRIAPQAAPVPFAQQQKSLAANPGRPIDPAALSGLQRNQNSAPAPVRIVNSATLTRTSNPTVLQKPPQAAPPVNAPVRRPTPAPTPPAPQANPGRTSAPAAPANVPARQVPPAAPANVPARQVPAAAPAPSSSRPAPSAASSQASSSAANLIATLKSQTIPNADRQLSEARKVAGIRLDLNAVANQLAAAKQALAGAERSMAAKNFDQALQQATAIQRQVEGLINQISAAMQGAKQSAKPASNQAQDQAPKKR